MKDDAETEEGTCEKLAPKDAGLHLPRTWLHQYLHRLVQIEPPRPKAYWHKERPVSLVPVKQLCRQDLRRR